MQEQQSLLGILDRQPETVDSNAIFGLKEHVFALDPESLRLDLRTGHRSEEHGLKQSLSEQHRSADQHQQQEREDEETKAHPSGFCKGAR